MDTSKNTPAFLSVERLSVEFKTRNGRVRALNDVSLNLAKGEVIGIVGESGSGKSVTAYTLMGLLDAAGEPVSGTAQFDGMTLLGASEAELRELRGREISMIFQNPRAALNPIRPVGKQIEDVLLRHAQAGRSDAKAKAIEMLDKVKILDPEHRYWSYPFELSGGMCQRVMIAIALACNPRLLIADEPTTGLDVTTQKATMDLIQELTRSRNMSVIVITHDLGLAAQYCDRITVMQTGKVVESAPVKTLFQNPQHPYTRKLIAASPGPDSQLAELTATPEELDVLLKAKANVSATPAQPVTELAKSEQTATGKNTPLLEVKNLVKVFPRRGSTSKWPWTKASEADVFRAVNNISFTLQPGEA